MLTKISFFTDWAKIFDDFDQFWPIFYRSFEQSSGKKLAKKKRGKISN